MSAWMSALDFCPFNHVGSTLALGSYPNQFWRAWNLKEHRTVGYKNSWLYHISLVIDFSWTSMYWSGRMVLKNTQLPHNFWVASYCNCWEYKANTLCHCPSQHVWTMMSYDGLPGLSFCVKLLPELWPRIWILWFMIMIRCMVMVLFMALGINPPVHEISLSK